MLVFVALAGDTIGVFWTEFALDVETDDVIQQRDVRRLVSYIMGVSELSGQGRSCRCRMA